MIFEDFKTAHQFLTGVLKLTISEEKFKDREDMSCLGFGIYHNKELVNFCYSKQELIEHAQYEFNTCIKLIRETSKKDVLPFYMDLLNFVRQKGELLMI